MGVSAIPPERPLIVWEPTSTPPAGYIKANGATLSRAAYEWLFNRIGVTFGAGDGVTNFKIPDLRGEFLRGLDDGRGVDGGRVLGSSQADDVGPHSHRMPYGSYALTSSPGGSYGLISGGPVWNTQNSTGPETRPRNVAGIYCIAYAP